MDGQFVGGRNTPKLSWCSGTTSEVCTSKWVGMYYKRESLDRCMCEHMRDPYLSTVLPGIWKNSGQKLKYYSSISTWRHFKRRVIQCTFCFTLFVFQSVSQQQQPPMNMSSTIKKKVTLRNINCRFEYLKEDRHDGERPLSWKTKKRSLRQIQSKTRFDNYIVREWTE